MKIFNNENCFLPLSVLGEMYENMFFSERLLNPFHFLFKQPRKFSICSHHILHARGQVMNM